MVDGLAVVDKPPGATSLNDTGLVTALVPGTAYTYHVEATNLAGPSGPATASVTRSFAIMAFHTPGAWWSIGVI